MVCLWLRPPPTERSPGIRWDRQNEALRRSSHPDRAQSVKLQSTCLCRWDKFHAAPDIRERLDEECNHEHVERRRSLLVADLILQESLRQSESRAATPPPRRLSARSWPRAIR